jgi:hypothetical protein
MIYLNLTDLSKETQERLLVSSKEEIKRKYGKDIIKYASLNNINLDTMLEEEAIRNLYSYQYTFSI